MAKHPQNSHRGLFSKSSIMLGSVGIFAVNYSEGTAALTFNSTGGADLVGTLSLGGFGKDMSQNSTGSLVLPTSGDLNFGTTVFLSANSTGLAIAVGTGSAAQISTA